MSIEQKLRSNKRGSSIEVLNLKDMDRQDAAYALNVAAVLRQKRLGPEEVNQIYNEGVQLLFKGSPLSYKNQDYFLFYPERMSKNIPARMRVDCRFVNSQGHNEMRNIDDVIAAGTIAVDDRGARFTGFSSTWMKSAPDGSRAYNFGKAVNDAMLDYFDISK